MKKCHVRNCGKEGYYYWNLPSGKIDLCSDHYVDMERAVHAKERAQRLANKTINIVAGIEYPEVECPNGKSCRWCKEFNL